MFFVGAQIKTAVARGTPEWKEVKCAHHVTLDDPARPLPVDFVAVAMRAAVMHASLGFIDTVGRHDRKASHIQCSKSLRFWEGLGAKHERHFQA
jgi:hypothetical protein